LFKKGQENSYPNILAGQFAQVGGGTFTTPFCGDDNIGGLLFSGTPIAGTRLYFNGAGPVSVSGLPVTEVLNHLTGSFSNLGVPGAKSYHLLTPNYGSAAGVPGGSANPYFARFASSNTTTVLADALAQNPTFFSLWIGGNDVLGYATGGGAGTNQTGNTNPATYGSGDITDPGVFNTTYNNLISQLVAGGKKGVVANLPYVSTLPYFTTVPTNPVPALPASSAAQLNQLFAGINQITTSLGQPNRFSVLSAEDNNSSTIEKANPLLIVDEALPNLSAYITGALTPTLGAPTATYLGNLYGRARHARNTSGDRDYILLTTRGLIATVQAGAPSPFNVIGISNPLQDATVLTADEVNQIKVATDAYNVTIEAAAAANGLALFDAKAVMNQLVSGGIRFGNYHLSAGYATGGAFSLDGVHPSARGYALIANKFLEAINAKYGSTFKPVDLGTYPIQYPASF
jgi:lysophospholipase L1-like esterase